MLYVSVYLYRVGGAVAGDAAAVSELVEPLASVVNPRDMPRRSSSAASIMLAAEVTQKLVLAEAKVKEYKVTHTQNCREC